jgi:Flagellar transcriptional activator (FlhC)
MAARSKLQEGAIVMRISDDRYQHERQRMELALRLLRHEARTQTIRAFTGLSDDRIRKLYRSYMAGAQRQHPRHRGKSPHQVAYFTRSLRRQQETALLASALSLLGALPASPGRAAATLSGVPLGELLCQAFEAYRQFLPSAQISFEHAYFLVSSLARGELLRLANCSECGCLMVTERLPLRTTRCHHCT